MGKTEKKTDTLSLEGEKRSCDPSGKREGESREKEVGDSPLSRTNTVQVSTYSLWLRIGQVMPNMPAGGVRSRGLRAINVSCFANKKY